MHQAVFLLKAVMLYVQLDRDSKHTAHSKRRTLSELNSVTRLTESCKSALHVQHTYVGGVIVSSGLFRARHVSACWEVCGTQTRLLAAPVM